MSVFDGVVDFELWGPVLKATKSPCVACPLARGGWEPPVRLRARPLPPAGRPRGRYGRVLFAPAAGGVHVPWGVSTPKGETNGRLPRRSLRPKGALEGTSVDRAQATMTLLKTAKTRIPTRSLSVICGELDGEVQELHSMRFRWTLQERQPFQLQRKVETGEESEAKAGSMAEQEV